MPAVVTNPLYRPSISDLALLTQAVHAAILKVPGPLSPSERTQLSKRLTHESMNALMKSLPSTLPPISLKSQKIAINGKTLIFKGCTFVESVDFFVSPNLRADLGKAVALVLIDIGITVDGRVGDLKSVLDAPKPSVDYYIIPSAEAIQMIDYRARKKDRVQKVHMYKYLRSDARYQALDMRNWCNRFDVLVDVLGL